MTEQQDKEVEADQVEEKKVGGILSLKLGIGFLLCFSCLCFALLANWMLAEYVAHCETQAGKEKHKWSERVGTQQRTRIRSSVTSEWRGTRRGEPPASSTLLNALDLQSSARRISNFLIAGTVIFLVIDVAKYFKRRQCRTDDAKTDVDAAL